MTILKNRLMMTASERVMGRFMRAPDHPTDGGGEGAPAAEGGNPSAETQPLSAAEQLSKEFGEGDDGDITEEGGDDEGEDLGSTSSADEGDADGDGEASPDAEGGDPEPKNRTEERISALTNAARESDRQAAEARREAEKWRRLAESTELPPVPEAEEGKADPSAPPSPDDFDYGEADPKYIAALAKHETLKEIRSQNAQAQFNRTVHELEAKYQDGVKVALETYPDYDEVVTKSAVENKWACPPMISLGIRDSEVGHDIAYHLASNPDESFRLADMDNIQQAREFGRLEGKFLSKREAAKQVDPKQAQPVKKSAAPTPPKAQARGRGGKFNVSADTDDFAAFDKAFGN